MSFENSVIPSIQPVGDSRYWKSASGRNYDKADYCTMVRNNTLEVLPVELIDARPRVKNGRFKATEAPIEKSITQPILREPVVAISIVVENYTDYPLVITDIGNKSSYVPAQRNYTNNTILIRKRFTKPVAAKNNLSMGYENMRAIFNPPSNSVASEFESPYMTAVNRAMSFLKTEEALINTGAKTVYHTTYRQDVEYGKHHELTWFEVVEELSLSDFRKAADGKSIYVPSIDYLLTLSDNPEVIKSPRSHPRHRQLTEVIQFDDANYVPGTDFIDLKDDSAAHRLEFNIEINDPDATYGQLYMYLYGTVRRIPIRKCRNGRDVGATITHRYFDETLGGVKVVVEQITVADAIDRFHLRTTHRQALEWGESGGLEKEAKLAALAEMNDLKLKMARQAAEIELNIRQREADLKEINALKAHEAEEARKNASAKADIERERSKQNASWIAKLVTATVGAIATVIVGAVVAVIKRKMVSNIFRLII